jgi:ABC-type amino acid transport substrate-binding protein
MVLTIKETKLYLAMHPGTDDQWINKLNEELGKLKASGFISELTKKYK